jgi:hypothetical protein
MKLRRLSAALAAPCALLAATAADAQIANAMLVAPAEEALRTVPDRTPLPQFTLPRGDFRDAGEPRRNGLIAALPVDDRLTIGIGRFRVGEIARPRTNMEPERAPLDPRRRDRGIAAVGMSLRF